MEEKKGAPEEIVYQKPELFDLDSAETAVGACSPLGSGDGTGVCDNGIAVTFGDEPGGPPGP